MNLTGRKVLVAGGAGFIGSHTVNALIREGAQVCIIDNLTTGRAENLNPEATFHKLNIADANIEKVFKEFKPDYAYNLAFNVRATKSMEDPLFDMDSIIGCINILKNVKKYDVKKIVFTSSGFIYGNTSILPTPETEPLDPVSPYAVAKYTAENYIRFYNKAYGIPYVIFRYATTYGPRQVISAMVDYIRKLKADEQAEFWGDPKKKTRDYIYVGDNVRANLMALDLADNYPNPTFNVSTREETSLHDLYWKIAQILGKKPHPIYHDERPGEQIRYLLDNSKIKRELKWEPTVDLDDGLKKIIFDQ